MAGSRQDELYDALQLKGYPEDFLPGNCIQADEYRLHCNPDAGVSFTGYQKPRPGDVVDEMLAILSDRNAIIQKKNWNMHRQRSIKYTGKGCRKEKQEYDE